MKDLDFDELDRAVNSLLPNNNVPAEEPPTAPPADNSTSPIVNVPAQPVSQPLAARRSTGRFMDVVHPSSDMRTTTVPPRPVSREGAVIAPSALYEPINEPLLPHQDTPWSPTNTPPVVTEAPQPVVGDWPDPIDFTGPMPSETPKTSSQPVVAETSEPSQAQSLVDDDKDINQIAEAINKTLGQDQDFQAPLESPFLTDAKVEKRPLGAFSTEVTIPTTDLDKEPTTSQPIETEISSQSGEDDVKQTEQPIEMDTPLPAELQDDLLLIEADNDTTGQPKEAEPSASPEPQTDIPVGPTSITQQYTEQPSTGDQPTGAIFDTGAYQKPLAHPAKKKSGWLMVLWIVLLLVAGAGAGAAVYFLVLPKL